MRSNEERIHGVFVTSDLLWGKRKKNLGKEEVDP
jgi:hypothetical protein